MKRTSRSRVCPSERRFELGLDGVVAGARGQKSGIVDAELDVRGRDASQGRIRARARRARSGRRRSNRASRARWRKPASRSASARRKHAASRSCRSTSWARSRTSPPRCAAPESRSRSRVLRAADERGRAGRLGEARGVEIGPGEPDERLDQRGRDQAAPRRRCASRPRRRPAACRRHSPNSPTR